jgi:hypothetical protein
MQEFFRMASERLRGVIPVRFGGDRFYSPRRVTDVSSHASCLIALAAADSVIDGYEELRESLEEFLDSDRNRDDVEDLRDSMELICAEVDEGKEIYNRLAADSRKKP